MNEPEMDGALRAELATYREAERTAAKVAAGMMLGPGMVFDGLRPGESIGTIGIRSESDRILHRCDGCNAREWIGGRCAYCGSDQ